MKFIDEKKEKTKTKIYKSVWNGKMEYGRAPVLSSTLKINLKCEQHDAFWPNSIKPTTNKHLELMRKEREHTLHDESKCDI